MASTVHCGGVRGYGRCLWWIYLSLFALENIQKQLKQELLSLQVQYEQEQSDVKKFPPLEDSVA